MGIAMKTSEVAIRADLPISTLRYYEKIGLITEEYILREENNYRNYAPEIIPYLEVIKNSLAVGFSIQDIKSMISKQGISKDEQKGSSPTKLRKLKLRKKTWRLPSSLFTSFSK